MSINLIQSINRFVLLRSRAVLAMTSDDMSLWLHAEDLVGLNSIE